MSSPAPEAPPPAALESLPRRLLPKFEACLLISAAGLVLLLAAAGAVRWGDFRHLGVAALLGAGASLLWVVVERGSADRSRPAGLGAWVAFPLALLLFFAQMPFIALAVYPPIGDFLESRSQEVRIRSTGGPAGRRLEIVFPLDMLQDGNNLRLDDTLVPPSLFEEARGLVEWRDARTLSLAIDEIEEILRIGPAGAVRINSDSQAVLREPGARTFRYANRARVAPQTVPVLR